MSNPTLTQTLVNPWGNNQDVPLDGGQSCDSALLWEILGELRITNQYLFALVNGISAVDEPANLRPDNLIEPKLNRLS
jgi:hypothetical protein